MFQLVACIRNSLWHKHLCAACEGIMLLHIEHWGFFKNNLALGEEDTICC